MPYGYNGKILHVNLSESTWEVETPSEAWYRTYMGGSAFASYYLLKYLAPETDPLSADNVLVFACSVVCGAPISGFNRYTLAAKSPLTGGFGESEAGGYWAPELKFAGFDAVVIRGRAPKPVYLWIQEGAVEIRDAASVWGMDNWETLEHLRQELGDKRIRVASIGPAGEQLVPFACVQNDLEHFNGRTGMGAVMGSKNLKAVAVRGRQKMEMADPDAVKEIAQWHSKRVKSHPPNVGLTKFGTPGLVEGVNGAGFLPTRNFKTGVFEGAQKLAAPTYHDTIFHSTGTCWACTVRCKRRVELADGPYPLDKRFGGPEYEALAALGSMLAVDDLPAVARGNQLCNLLGMDVISVGGVIAFAMECYEKGILTAEDTGGRSLAFGDAAAMLWLIEEIAHRRGIGEILAKGVKRAAETIGKGADRYAFHIKGNELAFHDGRGKTGMALGFALSATGADHIETPHDVAFQGEGVSKLFPLGLLDPVDPLETDDAKVRFFFLGQKAWGINNLLGLCNFCSVPIHAMTFPRLVAAVSAITGWETSLFEILQGAERSLVMARVFNNREGFTPKDDRLIRRWHEEMPSGPLQGRRITPETLEAAKALFYEMSGWDAQGRPKRAKLVELNLGWLADAA
ncbi:MAG: aldehyde ferredoxin oxidoreductase family protein [Desulfosarcinaceae bacterium]|nr:aldehyde ferredoxin oxidoreductase family protein [Desulfosarcinaceae bacterium]